MEGNLIDSARKGQSKIRYAAMLCSAVALVATTMFYSELTSRTGLLSMLKEGGQTCFTRVGQSFTAKILNQNSTSYLSSSFFSATEQCYGDLIEGWNKDFSKQAGTSHLLNTLVSNIHWFHAKLDGESSALQGKDAGSGDFGDRYTKIEEMKASFDEQVDSIAGRYNSSISYIKMTMLSLSFVVLLLMGIEFYSRKRRDSFNKMIELRAEDLISSHSFLGEEVEKLVATALEKNDLVNCSNLFKKFAETKVEKEPEYDVVVELAPEPELNIEFELEPEPELNIELELAPEPAPQVTLDIEFEPEESLISDSVWCDDVCETIEEDSNEVPYFTAPESEAVVVKAPTLKATNLSDALDAAFARLDSKLIEEQIVIDVKGNEHFLVSAKGECLEQVFFNLISNSMLRLRRLESKKRIHIFVQEIQGKIVIDYADNGEAIPQSIIDNKKSDSIMGIGLAISKSLIEESFGQIHFENSKDFGRHTQVVLSKAPEKSDTPRQLTTVVKGTKKDVMRRLEAMM